MGCCCTSCDIVHPESDGVNDATKGAISPLYSHDGWNSHFAPRCMHSRWPVEPSLQITPRPGTGPQPFGSGQGVVLRGGAHAERQMHAPSFSLPQAAPLNVVPDGHTLASGGGPHSEAAHSRYETEALGSGSDQPHDPDEGAHAGVSAFDDGGTSPHAAAVHGATKLRPVRVVAVCLPVSLLSSPSFADDGGGVELLEHATRKRTLNKEE